MIVYNAPRTKPRLHTTQQMLRCLSVLLCTRCSQPTNKYVELRTAVLSFGTRADQVFD